MFAEDNEQKPLLKEYCDPHSHITKVNEDIDVIKELLEDLHIIFKMQTSYEDNIEMSINCAIEDIKRGKALIDESRKSTSLNTTVRTF